MESVCDIRIKQFLSIKAWILTKKSVVKFKERNPGPVEWVFKSKEQIGGLIRPKSINVVKGYMQVRGVDFTE